MILDRFKLSFIPFFQVLIYLLLPIQHSVDQVFHDLVPLLLFLIGRGFTDGLAESALGVTRRAIEWPYAYALEVRLTIM